MDAIKGLLKKKTCFGYSKLYKVEWNSKSVNPNVPGDYIILTRWETNSNTPGGYIY